MTFPPSLMGAEGRIMASYRLSEHRLYYSADRMHLTFHSIGADAEASFCLDAMLSKRTHNHGEPFGR